MENFGKVNNLEELFKELDENQFTEVARPLGAYRAALMREGFTRREAMRLVETYSKFIYDICIEEYVAEKRQEEIEGLSDFTEHFSSGDEDVDEPESDDVP